MNVTIPYGSKTCTFQLPERNLLGIVDPADVSAVADPAAAVRQAIRQPVGTQPLSEMARRGSKVLIIVDDFTRPTPAYQLLPAILAELDPKANELDVTILIACGTHRPMTESEIRAKVGAEVMAHYRVVNHDAFDRANLVDLGTTKNGTPIVVNRLVVESDLVLGISNVCPHGLAGWSGGAKIIQPGVCSVETTNWTHAIFMMSPVPHIGRLDNPMRIEIEEVVKRAPFHFSINVVLNRHAEVVHIVAGDPYRSHRAAVDLGEKVWVVPIPAMPDIIVVSSYPADVDFWQGAKGLFPCETVIKRGGDIILATPCPERLAIKEHADTLRALRHLPSKVGRHEALRRGVHDLTAVNVVVWMARMNELATISIYSGGLTDDDLDTLGVARAASIQSALDQAFKRQGPDARVLVITQGGELCPVLRPNA